jgi:hypothetical protein
MPVTLRPTERRSRRSSGPTRDRPRMGVVGSLPAAQARHRCLRWRRRRGRVHTSLAVALGDLLAVGRRPLCASPPLGRRSGAAAPGPRFGPRVRRVATPQASLTAECARFKLQRPTVNASQRGSAQAHGPPGHENAPNGSRPTDCKSIMTADPSTCNHVHDVSLFERTTCTG